MVDGIVWWKPPAILLTFRSGLVKNEDRAYSNIRRKPDMAEIKVDCMNETCPVPLVETRKALRKAAPGDIVEVVGTHPSSKKEIPMAVKALGLELLDMNEEEDTWRIRIRK